MVKQLVNKSQFSPHVIGDEAQPRTSVKNIGQRKLLDSVKND